MNKYLIAGIILLVCALAFYCYKKCKAKQHKITKLEKYEEQPIQQIQSIQPIQQISTISVLLCYANWCGHCPEVKEWYIDLVNSSPLSNVTFTMCEEQDLPSDILNSIPGFPSILVFYNGQMKKYSGDRTKDDLLRYLKNI